MKLVIDTGALLSLACSHYFNGIVVGHTIIITPTVKKELEQFAEYGDFLGLKAREVIDKMFLIKSPGKIVELKLEDAEKEVFSLAIEDKLTPISDDIHAVRVAYEKLRLTAKPSFYLLLILYKQKKIKKEELIQDIYSIMAHRGWMSGSIGDYTLHLIEKLK